MYVCMHEIKFIYLRMIGQSSTAIQRSLLLQVRKSWFHIRTYYYSWKKLFLSIQIKFLKHTYTHTGQPFTYFPRKQQFFRQSVSVQIVATLITIVCGVIFRYSWQFILYLLIHTYIHTYIHTCILVVFTF